MTGSDNLTVDNPHVYLSAGETKNGKAVEQPLPSDVADELRHSYVALLDQAGASLREAMQLARHSDPKLTMRTYGRLRLADLGGWSANCRPSSRVGRMGRKPSGRRGPTGGMSRGMYQNMYQRVIAGERD